MKQPVIQFENFTFQYNSQAEPTLKNVNLSIYEGEKVCIVGPSGSGKSTLVHCLNGLVPFAYKGEISGSLTIQNQETSQMDIFSISKKVGTVLQDSDGQFIGLTVGEDIAFALENEAVAQSEMLERVQHASNLVGMEEYLQHRTFELSGGQKQRVALAGVLVNNVDILLYDEPLANLDPASGKEAMRLIEELHRETKKTTIIVEHRLEDVLTQPVDRIVLVNNGQIIADLKPDEMLASSYLIENWVREPLYISALKYAGCPLSKTMNLATLSSLQDQQLADKLQKWTVDKKKSESQEHSGISVLELKNISFCYPRKGETIKNVSFTINKGEMVSLVGTNGAGKSTLSKLICGFEKPTRGEIFINGENVASDSIKKRAERVGFVLQNPNQMFSKQIVSEEVAFGLLQKGGALEEIQQRVDEVLKICGLFPFRNWPISALSYGQKKRLSIATILVLQPSIIILDEPTAGQDYKHTTELMLFLQTLQQQNITIILITHDMHLMMDYTNRAIVLTDGQIIADDRPAKILTNREIIQRANLKESSLYTLAEQLKLQNPLSFVESFISYEREVRQS